jgi:hypothetical protein
MLKKDGEAEEQKTETSLPNKTPIVNLRHVQEAFRASNPSVSATERRRYDSMYAHSLLKPVPSPLSLESFR